MRYSGPVSRFLAAAAIFVGAGVALTARTAQACGSCGCGDPTLTALGADIPFQGRVRAYSGLRFWSAHSDEGEIQEARMDVAATWSPMSWLELGVQMPLQQRVFTEGATSTHGLGAGDLQISARALVFRDRSFSPHHLVHVFGGVELPTATLVRDEDGGAAPQDAQLGSGSWNPLVGAGYAWFADRWSGSVDVRFRLSTPGFQGHREGNATTGAAALQYQPWTRLGFRMGVEARYEGAESEPATDHGAALDVLALNAHAHSALTSSDANGPADGTLTTFLSPSVVAAVSTDLLVHLGVYLPVLDMGPHPSGPVLQFGATQDF
jgi:hypothetical protein